MEKLRILILNWRDPKNPDAGGAEKATFEIARRWVLDNHEVHWVAGGFSSGHKIEYIDGVKITRIGGKYSLYGLSPLYYLFSLRQSCDIIIDEINTMPFFSILFAKKPKVALIHQLAANVLFEELPWIQAKFWNIMEPKVLRMYRNVPFITSDSTKDDLVRIGIPEDNVHTINYGVDQNIYKPGVQKSPIPFLVYLGRLRKFKGVHYLIQALRKVVEEVPEARASIVGKGDPAYMAELKRLTRELDLTNHIDFCEFGYRDSMREKVDILQKAWALVFPSTREGFGLTVIEANACGTPAIAADVPGLNNTVKDHETGILVPPKNIDALAEAIIKLFRDEKLRLKLSRNALDWSKNFDWNITADRVLNILLNTINSGD